MRHKSSCKNNQARVTEPDDNKETLKLTERKITRRQSKMDQINEPIIESQAEADKNDELDVNDTPSTN